MSQHSVVWPKYQIPLTENQTTELGRLMVVWGQVDHFLFLSLSILLTHDLVAGTQVFGDMTTGQMVNSLRKARHRIPDDVIKEKAEQFCDAMGPLIQTRNHLAHGIWGFHLPGKSVKKARAGCHFSKNPVKPLFPEQVTIVANKASEQTFVIAEIWHHLAGVDYTPETSTFYFGNHRPRTPKGLQLVDVGQSRRGRRN